MQQSPPRHPSLSAIRGLAVWVALSAASAAQAQAQAPAPTANPNDPAAAERAHREGDKVFKWILIHADKPRRADAKGAEGKAPEAKAAGDKPAATAAAPAAPAPRPVARVKDEGITERVTPMQVAAVPARTDAPAAAPASAAPTGSTLGSPAAPASSGGTTLALAAPGGAPIPDPEPEPEDDDVPLTLVRQVDPEFPGAAMRRLQKGMVRVRFEVKPDGSVKETEVLKSSSASLNQAAQQAVAQWRFMPLKHVQYGIVELAFNLE